MAMNPQMEIAGNEVPMTTSSDVDVGTSGQLEESKSDAKVRETTVAVEENKRPAESKDDDTAKITADASDEESDNPPPSPRVTRARNRFIVLVDSDTDTDSGSARSLRRRSRQNSINSAKSSPIVDKKTVKGKEKAKSKDKSDEKNKTPVKSTKKSNTKTNKEADNDDDGEYVHVNVGDCVLLDSGDPESHFIALVSSVQLSANHKDKIGTFTAQWYYKPDDIRDEVRESIPGGVGPKEVFLSPHKDKNSIDAVIGTCDVYSKEEFDEIQLQEQRGFREKSSRLYFMCRYKYYPNRNPKKALEVLPVESIRGGLGPQKPKVGDNYQAVLPKCLTEAEQDKEDVSVVFEQAPWRHPKPSYRSEFPLRCKAKQIWSPLVVSTQELLFRQYRELLNTIRFSTGNIVKMYRNEGIAPGMIRCMVLKYIPSDSIQVCCVTNEVKSVLPSDVYSPLSDDVAFKHLYLSRFNVSLAIHTCTQELIASQQNEQLAYTQEVRLFARVKKAEEEHRRAYQNGIITGQDYRKRRK